MAHGRQRCRRCAINSAVGSTMAAISYRPHRFPMLLKNPVGSGRELEGPKAVAFVRNHDIDRGQNNDHGIEDPGGRNSSRPGMAGWRERLYSGLVRIATRPTEFFRIPPDRVIELGA